MIYYVGKVICKLYMLVCKNKGANKMVHQVKVLATLRDGRRRELICSQTSSNLKGHACAYIHTWVITCYHGKMCVTIRELSYKGYIIVP